jgi:hypothetical protein
LDKIDDREGVHQAGEGENCRSQFPLSGGDWNDRKTMLNFVCAGQLILQQIIFPFADHNLSIKFGENAPIEKAVYWRHWPEADFGKYIELQEINNCGINTVVMAFNIFFDGNASGNELAKAIDKHWIKMPFRFRLFPRFATTPRQQHRIAKAIIKVGKLPMATRLEQVNIFSIIEYLSDPKSLVIVTLGLWDPFTQPEITYGKQTFDYNQFNYIGSHTMIVAAYDPFHTDYDGKIKPWGVLCPWKKDAEGLFWLSDSDFRNNLHFPALILTLLE